MTAVLAARTEYKVIVAPTRDGWRYVPQMRLDGLSAVPPVHVSGRGRAVFGGDGMIVHFTTGPTRKQPKCGDRKTVKGVEYVRVFQRVKSGPDRGCYVTSRGKPCYEWERVE